jgi:hypothetical protein
MLLAEQGMARDRDQDSKHQPSASRRLGGVWGSGKQVCTGKQVFGAQVSPGPASVHAPVSAPAAFVHHCGHA